jgi:hypothetical protein
MQELVALSSSDISVNTHSRVVAASCYIKPCLAEAVCSCVVVLVYMQCIFVGYEWFFTKKWILWIAMVFMNGYIIYRIFILLLLYINITYIISIVNCFVREGWPLV